MGREFDYWLGQTAELGLNDVAFALWTRKSRLDDEDAPQNPAPPAARPGNQRSLGRMMRDAVASVLQQREHAPDGPTFDRLKAARPQATDGQLRDAIRAAIKLETDAMRLFVDSDEGLGADARRAVAQARLSNPGFAEATYRLAESQLCYMMR